MDHWHELLLNLAVVAIATSVWTLGRQHTLRFGEDRSTLVFGLVMSVGVLGTMAVPFQFIPGVFLDARYTVLAIAGYFGGPLGVVLPLLTALARRLAIGGTGVTVAIPQILMASLGGLALHRLSKHQGPSLKGIAILSLWAALSGVIGFYCRFHISRWLQLTADVTGPFALILCLATLVSGLAILHEFRRQKVTQENQMYRAVIEALPDCLNAKDLDGRFVIANPATAELMGTELRLLIGRTDVDFYSADTAQVFRVPELDVLSSGTPLTIEQKFARRDGAETWLSTLKAPLFDDSGETIGIITHNREITAQKQLEQELQKTQRLLTDAIESMVDGLAMFNSQGVLVFHNRRFHELFPLTADVRVPGSSIREIVRAALDRSEEIAPTADRQEVVERTATMLMTAGDRLIRLADGRAIEARTRPSDNGGSMIIFSDVTVQRNRETQLAELNDQLSNLAATDALTGLLNRRAFDAALQRAAVSRPQKPLSLVMIDIDSFKAFNDGYGHLEGDACLQKVAAIIKEVFKAVGGAIVARYGGEEFAVILPATNPDRAVSIATTACEAVRACAIRHDFSEKKVVTVSMGVACTQTGSVNELLKSADAALYAAKAAGRDCVRSGSCALSERSA
ncbi:diguanylate cyclase domain-containing protein [Oryzifoliimicrobium ureilyticus]|uniref:diguanylate cyclase domain-containing protein n=1 Tax=Oryzifoliimicrobium ureilyticus TaxID=3113724 RepID=UPI00307603CE